jgi:hypothetical protein
VQRRGEVDDLDRAGRQTVEQGTQHSHSRSRRTQ